MKLINTWLLAAFLIVFSIAGAQAQVISESFESGTFPPTGWAASTSGTPSWDTSGVNPNTGITSALVDTVGGAGTAILYTPDIVASIGDTITLSYFLAVDTTLVSAVPVSFTDSVSLEITIGNGQTVAAQTTTLQPSTSLGNQPYSIQTLSFPVPVSGTYNFAFKAEASNTSGVLYLDDIEVDVLPQGVVCAAFIVTTDSTNVTCFGAADGQAWAVPAGGVAPYNYTWSAGTPVGAGNTVIDLAPGLVTVTVTDDNGCVADASVMIESPTEILLNIGSTNPTTAGGTNGTAWVSASGGVPSYTYAWSDGSPGVTTDTTVGLSAGVVGITVTDNTGCTQSNTDTLSDLVGGTLNVVNISCSGLGDGTAQAIPTGGTPPYTHSWSRGVPGPTNDIRISLLAGPITDTVRDANGGLVVLSGNVINPDPIELDTVIVKPSCDRAFNGTATVSVVGGTPPFSYNYTRIALDTTVNIVANTPNNVLSGQGEVLQLGIRVTDSRGCIIRDTSTIPELDGIFPTIVRDGDTLRTVESYDAYQWFLYADTIAGATDGTLFFGQEFGVYSVSVLLGDCRALSQSFTYTSIETLEDFEGVSWYPNPTQGNITLKFDATQAEPVQVTILQMNGSVVTEAQVINQQHTFDLTDLQAGVYLVRLQAGDKVGYTKVVKY